MRLVTQYLKTGEKAKALTTVRKLQTANPTNPDLLDHLGQAQIANNDAARARSRLTASWSTWCRSRPRPTCAWRRCTC
ncbi:hypothetical protein LP419_18390 [Massilia sp. H-1]|nr:hypothetical protein LP419_18390 [Massilia sp. H-1]